VIATKTKSHSGLENGGEFMLERFNGVSGQLFIAPQHVVAVYPNGEYTAIVTTAQLGEVPLTYNVTESLDEVVNRFRVRRYESPLESRQ
jgi:hypothetical protein